jgi:hypothetical protein
MSGDERHAGDTDLRRRAALSNQGIAISVAAELLGVSEPVATQLVYRELRLDRARDPSTVLVGALTIRRLRVYLAAHPKLITRAPRAVRPQEIKLDERAPKYRHTDASPEAIAWRQGVLSRRKSGAEAFDDANSELAKALLLERKKPKGSKTKSRGSQASNKGSAASISPTLPAVDRLCSVCKKVVPCGLVTQKALPHNDNAGTSCAGSGLDISSTTQSTSRRVRTVAKTPVQAATKAPRVSAKTKEKSDARVNGTKLSKAEKAARQKKAALGNAGHTIRVSEQQEREYRRARYEEEFGRSDVRTRSGGLPSLGKRG